MQKTGFLASLEYSVYYHINLLSSQMVYRLAHTVRLTGIYAVGLQSASTQAGGGSLEMSSSTRKTCRASLCSALQVGLFK